MDLEGIRNLCVHLGLAYGPPRTSDRGTNISISCPLAKWSHNDPHDSNMGCSVLVNEEGPSPAICYSMQCGFRGTLYGLIQSVYRRDPTPKLAGLLEAIAKAERVDLDYLFTKITDRANAAASAYELMSGQPAAKGTPFLSSIPAVVDNDVLEEDILSTFNLDLPDYVNNRGVSDETATVWGLLHDTRLGRLVFPIRRFDGRLVGLTGRITPNAEHEAETRGYTPTKYHNYSGFNRTRYLYGAHLLRTGAMVVIVEGPFDALKSWQALGPEFCVVATLGSGFSREHAKTVQFAKPSRVYIFTDADAAGKALALKIVEQLPSEDLFLATTPSSAKDPGDLSEEEIRTAISNAKPVLGRDYRIFDKDPFDW